MLHHPKKKKLKIIIKFKDKLKIKKHKALFESDGQKQGHNCGLSCGVAPFAPRWRSSLLSSVTGAAGAARLLRSSQSEWRQRRPISVREKKYAAVCLQERTNRKEAGAFPSRGILGMEMKRVRISVCRCVRQESAGRELGRKKNLFGN